MNIEETIDIKIAALKAHKSQMGEWDPSDSVKEWSSAAAHGKEMAFAEAYKVVTLVDDKTWEKLHSNGTKPE